VLVSNSILTLRSSFSRAAAASTECMSWLLAGMKLLAPEASAVQELAAIFVPFGMVRASVQRYARILGYDVKRKYPTALETVRTLVGAEAVRTCFDVGAFRGEYARDMVNAFPGASVYAYEPNPIEFERLAANARSSARITAMPCGLGATLGSAELHIAAGTASSSLLPLEPDAAKDWGDPLAQGKMGNAVVAVVTIDSELKRLGLETLDFLKIDAQGFEAHILDGALQSLRQRRILAIKLEMLVERSYVGQALPHELMAKCYAYGLTLRGIYDTYFRDSRLMQFDALMVLA